MKKSDLEKLAKRCEEVSRMMKSLSHPVRLKLLCALVEGEKTVSELVESGGVSQSGVSQFLARFKSEGVVSTRKEGVFVFYSLADQNLKRLVFALREIYCT